MKAILPIIFLSFALTACSSNPEKDPFEDFTAEQIYAQAHEELTEGEYKTSSETFQALEAHFPFGEYTRQGQLEIIYSYYKTDDAPAALAAADKYTRLYPRSTHLDYAYYLKGLIKFNENNGLLTAYLPMDPSLRDVTNYKVSFQYFSDFVRRYPDSLYAPDSRQRLVYLRNQLANAEYAMADYYYQRAAYLAAANRASDIIKHYDQATVMPAALALLVKSYEKLGLQTLVDDARRVLALNYPETPIDNEQS